MMKWHDAISKLKPYIFNLSTPNGSGTGWLVSLSKKTSLCAVATAAHVIHHAQYWELPIRIFHAESGKNLLLRANDRSIHIEPNLDTAAIVFNREELSLPKETLPLMDPKHYAKPGVEIGWLGFPAIRKAGLCFFSGRISNYTEDDKRYLVDGVAINGVSGGPAFRCIVKEPELVGVVSAYIANRITGETLPGLSIVQDVTQFHDIAGRFKSLDEAKSTETHPEEPPQKEVSSEKPPESETRA